jgi:hypothetical protein
MLSYNERAELNAGQCVDALTRLSAGDERKGHGVPRVIALVDAVLTATLQSKDACTFHLTRPSTHDNELSDISVRHQPRHITDEAVFITRVT